MENPQGRKNKMGNPEVDSNRRPHEHDLCTCNHFRYEHRRPYETINELCIGFEMKTPAKYEEDHDV